MSEPKTNGPLSTLPDRPFASVHSAVAHSAQAVMMVTSTPSEIDTRAETLAAEWLLWPMDKQSLARRIAALLAEERERCAAVADGFRQSRIAEARRRVLEWGGEGADENRAFAREALLIAAAIRSLDDSLGGGNK